MKIHIFLAIIFITSISIFAQKQSIEPFSVESIQGTTYNSDQLRGKIVVLYFWSTTCPICESISPKLNEIANNYRSENTEFLAITADRKTKVEPFLKHHELNFDVIAGNFDVIFKFGEKGKDGEFNMPFPSLFVIDQNGEIQLKSVGVKAVKDLALSLEKLTAK